MPSRTREPRVPQSLRACLTVPASHAAVALASTTRRYWPSTGVDSALFQCRFPDRDRLLAMARLAADRQIQFWHPWHMELTHHPVKRNRRLGWVNTPTGDIEWTCSLLRFTHMLDLAAGHGLDADWRLRRAFLDDLRSFARARRRPHEIWQNLLNAALRVQNLLSAYDLLRDSTTLPEWVHLTVAEQVVDEVAFLHENIGRKEGNWEFAIVTAVLLGVDYFHGALDLEPFRARAESRLATILKTEVLPGGVFIEQAPMYHGEVILHLLHHLVFLQRNDLAVVAGMAETIEAMTARLVEKADPEGRIPPIGDSDRHPVDYLVDYAREVLGKPIVGSALIPQPAGGNTLLTTFSDTSRTVVRRWRDDGSQHWFLFDGSGKPPRRRDWHSHADDLQFLLHTSDGPLVTDPGRFTYAGGFRATWPLLGTPIYERGRARFLYRLFFRHRRHLNDRDWRHYFTGSAAHNVLVPGRGDFPGYRDKQAPSPRVRLDSADVVDEMVCLAGNLESPRTSASDWPAFRHWRTILSPDPDRWLIVDSVSADADADWTGRLHLGAGVNATTSGMDFQVARGPAHHVISVTSSIPERSRTEIIDDWVSEVYNHKVLAPTIRTRIASARDFAVVTSILCHQSGPGATLLATTPAIVLSLAVSTGTWWWRLAPTADPDRWAWGDVAARIAWVLADGSDNILRQGEIA